MFKPKTPISGRLENSSGEWIRTTDLRVMREKPDFGIIDRKTMQISESNELRFYCVKQTVVANQHSYSMPFGGRSQVLFRQFYAFSLAIQGIKLIPLLICNH
jgi:hypothetical protein